ncbi:DUF3592 domain-containing protein [Kingella denitrificans]|jgi:hypothetical protein|uniref:DUF3592 domain-containing protein n=2 Tax=Kingella denitrificans TaxID=502 RepID=UPI000B97FBE5|nr:DUF3592 domain-containing protein [Kingella denitrificans]
MNIKSILLCLILIPFGIMSLISGYRTTKNNSLFQETSKTATFTPASDGYTEYRKRRSSKVYYTLDEMTYTAETGETVNVKSVTVDADELAKLKAGEGIQCSYLPSDKQNVRCQHSEEPSAWKDFLSGLVSLFVAGSIFMNARREKQQQQYEEEYEDDEDDDTDHRKDDGVRFS